MQLNWTELAVKDLDNVESYIAEEGNPVAAIDLVIQIIDVTEKILLQYPDAGRSGRVTGTRELVIKGTSFIVIYRNHSRLGQLQVLRVLHDAREWPA
jgi:toxin ParE1/3/4